MRTSACSDSALHLSLEKRGKRVPLVYQCCKKQEHLAKFTKSAANSAMAYEQVPKGSLVNLWALLITRLLVHEGRNHRQL